MGCKKPSVPYSIRTPQWNTQYLVSRCSLDPVVDYSIPSPDRSPPGTPHSHHSIQELVDFASQEAELYAAAGVDGILVENMHDIPYLQGAELGPEVTATMACVCSAVKQIIPSSLPCGVQILAGGNKEALAVSKACNLQFIRAECFVFSHIADEGLMNASAGPLLRYRKMIGADDVLVFTDIKKKHSAHSLTADVDVVEMAKAADFFSADGVILTGSATGCEADQNQLRNVVAQVSLPVVVGSGVTVDNVDKFLNAHGLIVGSHFKAGGRWNAELDFNRVKIFVEHVQNLRARTISSDLHLK